MKNSWANHDSLSHDSIFEAVHTGLTVRMIMTPRKQLKTCNVNDDISQVVSHNFARFDYFPVLETGDDGSSIKGLFHAAHYFDGQVPEGIIQHHFMPLTEDHLIGADASILDFIIDADTKPCRLVLAGSQISGLVSISDLQKLPVRACLFALITGLEITMAEAIRVQHPDPASWLEHLSDGRKTKINMEIEASKDSENFVDPLLFTQFADKQTILLKGFDYGLSKIKLNKHFKEIRKLRDSLAHANDYAASYNNACNLCKTVRQLLSVREKIAETGS
jgi:hypothetical protein